MAYMDDYLLCAGLGRRGLDTAVVSAEDVINRSSGISNDDVTLSGIIHPDNVRSEGTELFINTLVTPVDHLCILDDTFPLGP